MIKPVARPLKTTPTSPDQASTDIFASLGCIDPPRFTWTSELERRRRAVDRWRGLEPSHRRYEEESAE